MENIPLNINQETKTQPTQNQIAVANQQTQNTNNATPNPKFADNSQESSNNLSMSFENAMNELEKIVAALEGGQLQLETAIKYYARGLELHKNCNELLENAKLKVQNILHNQGKAVDVAKSNLEDEYSNNNHQ